MCSTIGSTVVCQIINSLHVYIHICTDANECIHLECLILKVELAN